MLTKKSQLIKILFCLFIRVTVCFQTFNFSGYETEFSFTFVYLTLRTIGNVFLILQWRTYFRIIKNYQLHKSRVSLILLPQPCRFTCLHRTARRRICLKVICWPYISKWVSQTIDSLRESNFLLLYYMR